MGYTHNRGFSIKGGSSEGYAVGSKGSERKIINSSGVINLPQVDKAGAPALTKVGTTKTQKFTIAKSATTATGTKTLTKTSVNVTNSIPANHFMKWKTKIVFGAKATTATAKLIAVTPAGSSKTVASIATTSLSATKLTKTATPIVATPAPAGSSWKQQYKVVLTTAATKKLSPQHSLLTFSIQKNQPVYLNTIT